MQSTLTIVRDVFGVSSRAFVSGPVLANPAALTQLPETPWLSDRYFGETQRMTQEAMSEPEPDDHPADAPTGRTDPEPARTECRAALDEMSAEAERLGLHY